MSAPVLLNLLLELRKRDKLRGYAVFNKFNYTCRSTNVRFYLSYDSRNTLKLHFWC